MSESQERNRNIIHLFLLRIVQFYYYSCSLLVLSSQLLNYKAEPCSRSSAVIENMDPLGFLTLKSQHTAWLLLLVAILYVETTFYLISALKDSLELAKQLVIKLSPLSQKNDGVRNALSPLQRLVGWLTSWLIDRRQ